MKDLRGLLVEGVFSLTAAAVWAGPPASIPTNDPAQARAEASFQTFASEWMQKMERVESQNRAQAHGSSYRGYASEFTTELKPTGSADVCKTRCAPKSMRLSRATTPRSTPSARCSPT